MTERDEVRRLLGGLDAGYPRHLEHVALGDLGARDLVHRLRLHEDLAPGERPPVGGLLGRDVDHTGTPQGVEMGQTAIRH